MFSLLLHAAAALRLPPAVAGWPQLQPARSIDVQTIGASTAEGEPVLQSQLVAFEGFIMSRRLLGRSLAFVDLQELDDAPGRAGASQAGSLQVLLKAGTGELVQLDKAILAPGARVAVLGSLKLSPRGTPLLVAQSVSLLSAAPSVHGIQTVLAALRSGSISLDEAVEAMVPFNSQSASSQSGERGERHLERESLRRQLASGEEMLEDVLEQLSDALVAASPKGARRAACGVRGELPDAGSQRELQQFGGAALAEALELAAGAASVEQVPKTAAAASTPMSVAELVHSLDEMHGGVLSLKAVVSGRRRLHADGASVADGTSAADGTSVADGACCLLELQDSLETQQESSLPVVRAVLHPCLLTGCLPPTVASALAAATNAGGAHLIESTTLGTLSALAAPGSRWVLVGLWNASGADQGGERSTGQISQGAVGGPPSGGLLGGSLLVLGARLQRCTGTLSAVRCALDAIASGAIGAQEGAHALRWDVDGELGTSVATATAGSREAEAESARVRRALGGEVADVRRWRAAELARALQDEEPPPQLGLATLTEGQVRAIEQYEPLRRRHPLRAASQGSGKGAGHATAQDSTQDAASVVDTSLRGVRPQAPLRAARGVSPPAQAENKALAVGRPVRATSAARLRGTSEESGLLQAGRSGSRWAVKKRPQIEFMAEQVEELLHSHPQWGERSINVVDVGAGKGLLARHLAERWGWRVNVSMVDTNVRAVRSAANAKGRPENLNCFEGDASESEVLKSADVLVGLHACGGLSDLILASACVHGAGFAVVTCCFRSHRECLSRRGGQTGRHRGWRQRLRASRGTNGLGYQIQSSPSSYKLRSSRRIKVRLALPRTQ